MSAKEIKVEELSKNIKKNLFETSQNLFKSIHLENEKISETSINLPIGANNSSSTFIKTTGALTTTSRHQFLNESQI